MTAAAGEEGPYAILLYGSRARGDHDQFSDVDVLVLSANPPDLGRQQLVEAGMSQKYGLPVARISVSSYSFEEFQRMAAVGTLFARHIGSEAVMIDCDQAGQQILSDALASVTTNAVPVTMRDLCTYTTALQDVKTALATVTVDYAFELRELRTLLRHVSVLASGSQGAPVFGRTAAFKEMICMYKLPESLADDYAALFLPGVADEADVRLWLGRAEQCLEALKPHAIGAEA